MKNYKETAQSVFEKSEKIITQKKHKKKKLLQAGFAVMSICIVSVLSTVFIKWGKLSTENPILNKSEGAQYSDNADGADIAPSREVTGTDKTGGKHDDRLAIISDYEASSEACYVAPENGDFFFSYPLTEAMKEYKDRAIYVAAIDIFSDGSFVNDESILAAEKDRLDKLGIDTDIESRDSHRILKATICYPQLKEFNSDKSLGYFFFLYDEKDA